ncbi:MAG TPA: amino acid adenylation domain-containing protein, partial [Pyrinomonadaceae bacterium]|nr:amino acid adenylation domain-containing protein [Pyrinomonadaceae bacterium]
AVLGGHESVRQAVVIHSESERLVGFVVLEQAGAVSGQQLRQYAGEQLPEYMVPAVVVELEQLPVTSHGKIDRRALAAAAAGVKARAAAAYVAPRTEVERAVSEIWAEVLGVERVGLEDNFFDLGGHSLLATQVVSRLREEYGVELGVRQLFEEQTVRGLAQAIEREGGEAKVETGIRIGERGEGEELPLSFAQQRLWFMNKVHPTSSFYNTPLAVRLSGPLRVAALEKTLGEIIRRHESLRTRFDEVNGRPVQVIEAASQFHLPLIDLRGLPDEQRESEFRSLMNEQANRPFDLRNGPVVRASLVQLGEEEHVVLWTMHHIVSDAWSIGVLIREVVALYEAFATGKASPLPELSVQYADFSQWQRKRFSGTFLADQLDFWKERLEDAPPVLELTTDHPRPATPSFSGASLPLEFSEELSTELRRLSREEGATLFMVLLAAYQTLLHRYTRQEDILVATSIANRNSAELEQLIGFFVNTLVMRVNLSGDKTFRELVREVREIALDAYAHQDLPFEKLVEELHPEREFNRNPLAHLFFSLQNAPISELKLPDLKLAPEGFESSTTRFDLELNLWERPQAIGGQMTYSTDLFEEATIKRMLHYFEVLLQAIVANPDQRLSALPLLTETECEQLLKERVSPRIEYPQGRCIHHFFEAQVEKMPEAVALISDEESVTYVELNRRANKLACYLRKRGVGPEAMVGLFMARSVEMVVALLGILKAGGAYVPLDPKYPKQRLEFMLEDTGVQLLLTQEQMLEKLPATLLEIICLDTEWEQMAHESEDNPHVPVTADNLAYVTYTSGSTGTPKGTLIPHRAVAGYMFGVDYMQFDADQTFIHYSSPSWDTLTFELWTSLLHGSRCVLYSPDYPSPEELGHALQKHGVTVLWLTSSLFNLTIDVMPAAVSGVKQLVTGGETLSVSHIRRALTLAPATRLVNGLGPSECTVFSLCYVIPRSLPEHLHTIPVGKPVGDRRVYLLDDHLRPAGIGIPGELYVGGPGVARGYLNQPVLTAERFVPDPFSDEPGARLYKSGDLMRYLPDGNIEFLGRVDDQVKVRGFRIEVKEIESVLDTHPGIRESFVIVREDSPGDKRLVAYVVTHGSPEQSEQERAGWQNKRLSEWQTIYDDLYSRFSSQNDPTFNIKGWNSFYTGEPIPADEMRVWRDTTVERILSLKPRNVLEVGCGSGLLLFQIAPHCAKYWATDFSQKPLDYVRKHLASGGRQLSHVRLLQRAATNFEGIEAGSFDVVILNSIVQYFPDLDYLLQVVAGAIKVLRPGGFIFLGDLRDLSLLKVFHTSLQLFQADTAESTDELWQRVQRAVDQEEELFIDPGIFARLREYFPQIGRVNVRLQRGKHLNELNRFRFDAVLHVGEPQRIHECPYIDWKPELALHDVRDLLLEKEPEEFGLRHVPNARVEADVRAVEMLNNGEVAGSVGEFREALKSSPYNGVDPESVWALGAELPYLVEVHPSDDHGGRYFDVIFKRRLQASSTLSNGSFPGIPTRLSRLKPLDHYANYPLRGMLARHLIPQLRNFLSEKLPEYMLPSAFVVLDALPRSHNGKIDRRALPAPVQNRRDPGEDFVAPRTPVEEVLADIWSEVLGVEQIGVHESFFDIGGHSLLATQVLSRVHNIFRVELPLSKLFEATTIAELANAVVAHDAKPGQTEKIANILKKLKGMSPELLKETLQHKKGEARYEQ